jgi:tryptophan-rich sensory protein
LNLTTATSAWRVWRAREPRPQAPPRREVLAWWVLADAALLFAVMVRYAFLARRVDQTAAVLAVPEVAWTAFATVLSTAVAAKNG